MKIPIFPQNSSKISIFKILINYFKKSNGPNFFFFSFFLFYLTCFTTVPIFESNGPLVAEIWGGGQISPPPPPPPMDSSPQNNPMGKCSLSRLLYLSGVQFQSNVMSRDKNPPLLNIFVMISLEKIALRAFGSEFENFLDLRTNHNHGKQ